MNQARRAFPLQSKEAALGAVNQGGTTILSSLARARGVFCKERER